MLRISVALGLCDRASSRTTGWNSMEFHLGPARKLSTKLYDIYNCLVYSE